MNIIVAVKVVADDQDIQVAADRSLDFSKAHQTISTYDLNAIEAAAQLAAAEEGSSVTALCIGASDIDDSKLKKNILARGAGSLIMGIDDAYADCDAHVTACALATLLEGKSYDLILCGDGSADVYAQQVDVQLAAILGLPVANAVTKINPQGESIQVERLLEDVVEVVELNLPAVVSVTPDIGLPRIPGMKDILAAGKKPMEVSELSPSCESSIEIESVKAPEQIDRKQEISEASSDGAIEAFAQALKSAL